MKNKFVQELFTYFWIPVIISLVLYIFRELQDVILGFVVLIALSSVYVLIRLYFIYKKWWLLIILLVIVLASTGYFFARSPAAAITINGTPIKGSGVSVTGGSISVSPVPESNNKYVKGVKITLTATPAAGYDWKSWTGTDSDISNPTTLTMDNNKDITVTFEPRSSLIINNQLVIGSVASFEEGLVSVNPVPGDDGKYSKGTEVILSATPTSGYDWKSWAGTNSDVSNPTTLTMNGNKQITVTFEPRFTLTISNQLVIGSSIGFTEGSVKIDPAPGPDDKYARNTVVTLTAIPSTGYGWKNWSGTGSDTSNPAKITISSDKHVTVAFELRFLLTVNNQALAGPSAEFTGGSVSTNPPPGTDGQYSKDSITVLTALPAQGYRFDSWSGDVSGGTSSITIPMNTHKNISANFIKVYTLTISASPAEGGSITPGNGVYDAGSSVILNATPASEYSFDNWSGDASGSSTPITIIMSSDKTLTANFIKGFALTTSVSPAGSGSVSPDPGFFDEDEIITLTATPATGYRFDHWSGDASGNVTSTTVTMNTGKSVTANFVKVFTLTVSVSPTGSGTITSIAGTYDEGATATITATPATGFVFDRWSGDISGDVTNPTITITMNSSKAITAIFKNG